MAKEILRFKGLSLNRDEQAAGHGELSVCAGVELHDGALRPSVLEGTKVPNKLVVEKHYDWTEDVSEWTATLLYVHETASYRHFIGTIETLENELWWFNEDGTIGSNESIHNFREEIISVNSIGNALIVLTESGVHYVQWRDGAYKYIGTQPPFVDISFRPSKNYTAEYDHSTITEPDTYHSNPRVALRQLTAETSAIFRDHDFISPNVAHIHIYEEHKTAVTESVWALINQANNTIAKEGHFYAPFLIRYCYRLYDGTSLIMHSAPMFMNVSLPYSYYVALYNFVGQPSAGSTHWSIVNNDYIVFGYEPNNVGIRYNISHLNGNAERLRKLKEEWSDIVKSIDIFVSPMMTREKTGEQIEEFRNHKGSVFGVRDNGTFERYEDENLTYADIPLLDEKEYLQKLKDCSTFYKLMSFDLKADTITADGNYRDLQYNKDIVRNITSQELMKDDYHSHCRMSPMEVNYGMYIYNHRLNLYGMKEKLFEGFHLRSMINTYNSDDNLYVHKIIVELNTEEGNKFVEKVVYSHNSSASNNEPYTTRSVQHGGDDDDMTEADNSGQYPVRSICHSLLFYPDSRAVAMTLYFCDSEGNPNGKKLVLDMEPSNFLNGAVTAKYFYKDSIPEGDIIDDSEQPTLDDLVPMPNKVITSEVDNPYYFPIEGRNTVGIGAIVGLAAVTRALSQGQVGDHDLIAFCTDGIWVLKVSSTGTYSAMHNISREVCTNAKSICQLDQSVVFATQRSLSRFVESNVVSMSDMLDGPIRNWSELFGSFFDGEDLEPIRRQLEFGTPAVDIFNHGSIFYDYAGARVVVLPEHTDEASVAFVFSVRDQTWSTMPIPPIRAVVPGYPSPFVQLGGDSESEDNGKVIILDKSYDYDATEAEASHGLILTRTLTFSDTMDVIRGFQHHADSEAAPVLFLFGSNDQRHWQAIGQTPRWYYNYLPGQSYRFFRIAIYTQMKPSEEYQDLVLEIINKYGKL